MNRAAITLAVYGASFAQDGIVQWNGSTLSGTWVSATEMTATVPASDLVVAGSANVTVVNQGTGGSTSATQTFKITAVPAASTWVRTVPNVAFATNTTPFQAANTVWDAAHGKLYIAIPSTASAAANTIAVIDPIAGTATYSGVVGNNPDLLSISSDYSYLWVGLDGDHAVQRLLLPGLTEDISFPVPQNLQPVSLQGSRQPPHGGASGTLPLTAGKMPALPSEGGGRRATRRFPSLVLQSPAPLAVPPTLLRIVYRRFSREDEGSF